MKACTVNDRTRGKTKAKGMKDGRWDSEKVDIASK